MSDVEEVPQQVEEVEVADAAPAAKGAMSIEDALQEVLKKALIHDGLARGLREAAKALDRRQAHLCVLVETCNEPEYLKLIEALCNEHKIDLLKVSDPKTLGTWAGLCKIDREVTPVRSSAALASSSRTTVRSRRVSTFSSSTSRAAKRLYSLCR